LKVENVKRLLLSYLVLCQCCFVAKPTKPLKRRSVRKFITMVGFALPTLQYLRFEGEKEPVIVQHQISYVQSLSVLAMLQERDKAYKNIKKRGSLFAMGAPIMSVRLGNLTKNDKIYPAPKKNLNYQTQGGRATSGSLDGSSRENLLKRGEIIVNLSIGRRLCCMVFKARHRNPIF